jgi:hypothetical protein
MTKRDITLVARGAAAGLGLAFSTGGLTLCRRPRKLGVAPLRRPKGASVSSIGTQTNLIP